MRKDKYLFITFEGIEGSGKSYQGKKLYRNLKKRKIPVIFTREPGGSTSAEKIRKLILTGSKNKFTKTTDTLLYLAARNEHIQKTLKPAISRKKNIICDRFIDSTMAYQVYGKSVNKSLVNTVHKHILESIKPNLTVLLKVNIKKAFQRIKKRKFKNRYDKFDRDFYQKVQNAFIKIAKKNKKRYFIIDNSIDSNETEKIILKKIIRTLSK